MHGSEGVPLNARIWLEAGTGGAPEHEVERIRTVELRGPSGVVPTVAFEHGLIPLEPLEPRATYGIYAYLPNIDSALDSCRSYDCLPDEPVVRANFTTGDSNDTTAPTYQGAEKILSVPWLWGVCADLPYHSISFSPTQAEDDATDSRNMRYNIYRANEPEAVIANVAIPAGIQICDYDQLVGGNLTPGAYLVRAADLAGIEDHNTSSVWVDDICKQNPLDRTDIDLSGSGPVGCRATGNHGSSEPPWVVTVVLVCAWLRRSRSLRRWR